MDAFLCLQIHGGICDRMVELGPGRAWSIRSHDEPMVTPQALQAFRDWRPDGILTIEQDWPGELEQLDCPLVGLLGSRGTTRVVLDEEAIGEVAADHLISQGYRQLACWGGYDTGSWWRPRRQGFLRRVAAARQAVTVVTPGWDPIYPEARLVAAWFRDHPEPLAVFCGNDINAQRLISAGVDAGIDIPGRLAVLGADDNPTLCHFCPVSLSSVRTPHRELGFQGAVLLEALLAGRSVPPTTWIRPDGVTVRRSTEPREVVDPVVTQALAAIDRTCSEPIQVDDVVAGTDLGRRTLEKRFKAVLGYGILAAITRARIRRIQPLFANPALTLTQIAVQGGFSDTTHLAKAFQRTLGMTPAEYRHRVLRKHDPAGVDQPGGSPGRTIGPTGYS